MEISYIVLDEHCLLTHKAPFGTELRHLRADSYDHNRAAIIRINFLWGPNETHNNVFVWQYDMSFCVTTFLNAQVVVGYTKRLFRTLLKP